MQSRDTIGRNKEKEEENQLCNNIIANIKILQLKDFFY